MNTITVKKLDGSTEQLTLPKKKNADGSKVVARETVQRVLLPDGTAQEIKVVERRTKAADDVMVRRRRAEQGSATAASELIPDAVVPADESPEDESPFSDLSL